MDDRGDRRDSGGYFASVQKVEYEKRNKKKFRVFFWKIVYAIGQKKVIKE